MSEISHVNSTGVTSLDDEGATFGPDWLRLAATPAFAIMAVMTSSFGGQMDRLCSPAGPGSLLSGMVPMYILMSAFHAAPWLRLVLRRGSARRT